MAYFGGLGGFGHSKPYKGDALAALGLGFANFVNGIVIRHPFIVLHRQCQVHDYAVRKHLAPTTLVPVIFKLAAKDGPLALWKGAVGSGVLWAFSRCSELIIAELFGLPKTYVPDGSSEKYWRHLWLKASNFIFCTPVIVASFVETVRSGANLTEDLQILEVITRGFERLYQEIFGGTAVVDGLRRRHSLLWLALPTSFYQVIHFLICRYVYGKSFAWMRAYVSRKMPSERKRYHTIMPELFSTMTSVFIADIACYPLETVLHRLYIQGTRTLVDNLDQGTGAFVPAGRYAGVFDCFTTITTKEGISALYSGVGALILQYMLQHSVASLVYWALDRGGRGYTSGPMTIKTAEYPSMQTTASTSAFNPFPSTPSANNMDPQFATSSQQTSASVLITDQPASSSSLFPTFAETQQRSFNSGGTGKQADNNPFFAALRQKKSGAGFTTQEYSNTTSSNTASPSLT